MPPSPVNKTTIQPNTEDALGRILDGEAISIEPDKWGYLEWQLPQDLHLAGAFVHWIGFEVGDYGFFATVNPLSEFKHPTTLSGSTIDVGQEALAATYNPENYPTGTKIIVEFWSNNGNDVRDQLTERREVISVSGTVIILKDALTAAHQVDSYILASIVDYMSMRGDHNLKGGIPLIGSGSHFFGSIDEHELSTKITAGLCHCLRIRTQSGGSTRKIACAFFNRIPASV